MIMMTLTMTLMMTIDFPSLGKFSCPAGFLGHTWVPESVGEFGLVSDGSLRGSDLPEYAGDPVQFWKEKEFCMVLGSPPDYDDSEDSEEHNVRNIVRGDQSAPFLFANSNSSNSCNLSVSQSLSNTL